MTPGRWGSKAARHDGGVAHMQTVCLDGLNGTAQWNSPFILNGSDLEPFI